VQKKDKEMAELIKNRDLNQKLILQMEKQLKEQELRQTKA